MSQTVNPTTGKGIPGLSDIYGPIESELHQVEKVLIKELKSDSSWMDELLEHARLMGGKRMRPVFLLLSGACSGSINPAHLQMAAALEMIHTASLLHDDVLDHAETRRHLPTANSKWGNKTSVLLGDYLFTRAFELASRTNSPEAIRSLAVASSRVCSGEICQNDWIGKFDISEDEYLRMISAKTGELVGCGCRMGALLSNAGPEAVTEFDQFGQHVGIAFQIVDDILDLVGKPSEVGKTLGTDVFNQKPTLPLIHCLASLDSAARDQLVEQLRTEPSNSVVLESLGRTKSLEYARGVAADFAERAVQFANGLPPSAYSRGLAYAAEFVIRRSH